MEPDLRDLLAAWRGAELEEPRLTALTSRLRDDPAFRQAFVEEIRLLGMLKAVQSTEPRWLLLEDELGWSAKSPDSGSALEDQVMSHIHKLPPAASYAHWQWAAAAAVLVALGLWWFVSPGREPQVALDAPPPAPPPPAFVAVVVRQDGAQWEGADGPSPADGSPLPTGRLRLAAGRATMTFFSGAMLSVEGPAELDLVSVERVFCQQGKLRARVPPGSEGFTVLAPGAAVVDLGTEFGMNVAADGTAELMVFEGAAEVSVLNAEGHTLRSQLVDEAEAVEVDPGAQRIRDVVATEDQFVAAPELIPPALVLDSRYADEIGAAGPRSYWRFETMSDQRIDNELEQGPALRATGPVKIAGAPGSNRCAMFDPADIEQSLTMDDSWQPLRETGYAVELWVLSQELNSSTLVSLLSRADEPVQNHSLILELTGQSHHLLHDPCRVRFLDRRPAGGAGGVNVFSRDMYIPYRWHHLVAQSTSERLELYVDGELVGTATTDMEAAVAPCRVLIGRLKHGRQPQLDQIRPFVGRLDELALYDRALTAAEVRRHWELGAAGPN